MNTRRKKAPDLGDKLIAALRDTNRRIERGEPLTVYRVYRAGVMKKLAGRFRGQQHG